MPGQFFNYDELFRMLGVHGRNAAIDPAMLREMVSQLMYPDNKPETRAQPGDIQLPAPKPVQRRKPVDPLAEVGKNLRNVIKDVRTDKTPTPAEERKRQFGERTGDVQLRKPKK